MLTRFVPALMLCLVIQAQDNVGKREIVEGRQTGPLLLSISSDKTDYEAGETITITSELRNLSDHDIDLRRDTLQYFSMDVMLPGPDWLPFRDLALLSEEGSRTKYPQGHYSISAWRLKPGEVFVDRFPLNRLYKMPIAGKYKVIFHFLAPDSIAKGQNVVSNELSLSIAEKK
jgi:hypothetical protein